MAQRREAWEDKWFPAARTEGLVELLLDDRAGCDRERLVAAIRGRFRQCRRFWLHVVEWVARRARAHRDCRAQLRLAL
jgi:hypothetical protein